MRLEYLKQMDYVLSDCGRPTLPGGASAIPIPKGFVMPGMTTGGTGLAQNTFTKEIVGDAPWSLRGISLDQATLISSTGVSFGPNAVRLQIQLPNGRFLFGGNGIPAGQLGWVGSWRWAQDPEFLFQPGDKINVTVSSVPVVSFNPSGIIVNLLLDGAYLYFLRGGKRIPPPMDLGALDRYQGSVNENIMAPAWMSNQGIDTPEGFRDDYYIYATPDPQSSTDPITSFIVSAGGALTAGPSLFSTQIEPGSDFFVRRMLFDVQLFGSVTAASILGRIRTGAGFALNNTRIDLAQYLCGSEFAGDWKVQGGDSIYIDTSLVDLAGTSGSVTFQAFFEGFKRSRL